MSSAVPFRMFGRLLELGAARVIIPDAKIHPEDLARIAKMSDDALKQPVKLRLIAGSDKQISTEYPKWLPTT